MNLKSLTFATAPALALTLGLVGCGSSTSPASTAGAATGASGSSAAGSTTSGAASGATIACASGTLNGEGSTAQKNAIDEAIAAYKEACPDVTVNYNPTGSGAGIKQFVAGQVQFAGSDSALNADKGEVASAAKRCVSNAAWNLPMVTGPIAVAYNLDGVTSLTLTPAVIGNIFSGKITTWNDPAIAALNSGVTLPSTAIKVFFRSDESGTTENFTKYLKAASAGSWAADPAKSWPSTGSGEGREKSAGVSEGVKGTSGGITYVEWSYAKDNNLGVAKIDNGGGAVELTGEAVGKAVAAAKQKGTGNDLSLSLDYATKAAGAYPILLVTYEIVCSKGLSTEQAGLVKSFLTHFASAETQSGLEDLGYAPLPTDLQAKVLTAINALS